MGRATFPSLIRTLCKDSAMAYDLLSPTVRGNDSVSAFLLLVMLLATLRWLAVGDPTASAAPRPHLWPRSPPRAMHRSGATSAGCSRRRPRRRPTPSPLPAAATASEAAPQPRRPAAAAQDDEHPVAWQRPSPGDAKLAHRRDHDRGRRPAQQPRGRDLYAARPVHRPDPQPSRQQGQRDRLSRRAG
jgi:hypothetical protein